MSNKKNEQTGTEQTEAPKANRTVTFHAFATTTLATRRSYQIAGHKGCLVIERSLFADGDGPEELILNVDLVEPKEKPAATDKEAAKLAKELEKAAKAQAKLEQAQARAKAQAEKAQAILDKVKAATGDVTESTAQ